jgi:hypothetical protein
MPFQIFTTVVNRPPFVEYQARLFRKHLSGEHVFHVVDDSVEPGLTGQFVDVCAAHGVRYHRKPRRFSRPAPSDATAAALPWTYETRIFEQMIADRL